MCESLEPSTLEKTYIMGHRLVAFLSDALPSHPHYMDSHLERCRSETIRDLVWIHQRLDEIALQIDEELLNRYMDDYVPEPEEDHDDSTTCSSSSSGEETWNHKDAAAAVTKPVTVASATWESFDGWTLDNTVSDEEGSPHVIESDASWNSSKETSSLEDDKPEFDLPVGFPLAVARNDDEDSGSDQEVDDADCSDPGLEMDLLDDEHDLDEADDENDCSNRMDLSDILQAVRSSAFLREVSEQDVPYEWDSDASDSWAQEFVDERSECSIDSADMFSDSGRIALHGDEDNIRQVSDFGSFETEDISPCRLIRSLTFDEDMPDDEANWSGRTATRGKAPTIPSRANYEEDAPDDEAGSWASFHVGYVR